MPLPAFDQRYKSLWSIYILSNSPTSSHHLQLDSSVSTAPPAFLLRDSTHAKEPPAEQGQKGQESSHDDVYPKVPGHDVAGAGGPVEQVHGEYGLSPIRS